MIEGDERILLYFGTALETISKAKVAERFMKNLKGISLLFKSKFKKHIIVIKNTKNFIWSRISKEILNCDKDVYVCGTYIPPEKSNYFDKEIFDELENDINQFSSKANIIVLGDFNARTGKLHDFLSDEGSKHIQDTSEHSNQTTERENFDLTINNHGKRLIAICKTNDLRILNGRTKGDSLGRPTFHGKNGTSLIDYIICNQDLQQNIKHLVVKSPCYLSHHSQVTTWVNIYNASETDNQNQVQPTLEKLPLQYIWTNDSKDIFTKKLRSSETQEKFNTFLDNNYSTSTEDINKCVEDFENLLFHASKKSLKIKKKRYRHKSNNVANKKWFDKECRIQRHNLRKLANKKHEDPNNIEIRTSYHTARKNYKNTLELKKNEFHQNNIEELQNASEEPELFWKILKNCTDDLNDNDSKNMPSPSEWLTHFENLHSEHKLNKRQEDILTSLNDSEKIKDKFKELDQPITENELLNEVKKLKQKKAVYKYKIRNEMLKASISL